MKPIFVKSVLAGLMAYIGILPIAASTNNQSPITNHLIVSPTGPYTTIEAALADAVDGDTLEVRGGTYPALVVEKSVTIEGIDWPVIDGGNDGTVVTLAAPDIIFRGFEVRGSGAQPNRDDSGITLTAPNIVVENNRLREVLSGIFVVEADNAILRGNDITSKTQYDIGRKGDAIRLWYSQNVLVENNYVHDARDLVAWYSKNVVVRDNLIEDGRYGIHLMYCDGAQLERNRVLNNSVGFFVMYSTHVALRENDIRGQRGPSGYALGFKDADFLEVTGNVIVDNRAGAFVDNTPFSPQGYGQFSGNIFAFNDVGVIMLTAVRGNTFENNTFWENVEQMAIQGNGTTGKNTWRGNYWSDYAGFDANGDGLGDTPYLSDRFFENLTDREPLLRALLYSPAAQTIELAAASFPIIKPRPKLIDEAPRMIPAVVPTFAAPSQKSPAPLTLLGIGLLTVGLALVLLTRLNRKHPEVRNVSNLQHRPTAQRCGSPISNPQPIVSVTSVSKYFGQHTALDSISFDARPGEAIALWGVNGAGKTTLLKSILGLIDFAGRIDVDGHNVRADGKAARRHIGYVPQEAIFYDMSVRATMEFYARLKKVRFGRIDELLEKLGLAEHARKPVPALSGGLKQRLALAVALLADPPVLLLDEPTANLDAGARRDYLALLSILRRENKTIIFASHRIDEVETLADRVVVMESGKVVETLTPGQVRLRLAPHVELTLWVPGDDRQRALALFQDNGLNAHLNGRGTVVVQIAAEQKLQPLSLLAEEGISVQDFEMERGRLWN
jgi:nitrous oxidase accessory protein